MEQSPTGSRILVVEDDVILSNALVSYLRAHQLEALGVTTLGDARQLLDMQRFDLVLLDLNLGAEDGIDLARLLVERRTPPFIITTSRIEEADRVLGLELGAHDYVLKPFSLRELLARIHGVIRRAHAPKPSLTRRRVASFDGWTVDLLAHEARHASGRLVELTTGECGVLRAFLDHPHRVLWRHELLTLTRRDDGAVFSRTVDVLVTRLRKKIEATPGRPKYIRTVRGEGYRFDCDVQWEYKPL